MNSHTWIFSALCVGEVALLSLAGFAIFMHLRHSFAEAGAYACISAMMLLSFSFQMGFITGVPHITWAIEASAVLLSVVAIIRFRGQISCAAHVIKQFSLENPLAALALFVCWGYLAVQATILPAEPGSWFDLSDILIYEQDQSFFSGMGGHPLYPVNANILPHMFLRFGTDCGIGVFGFLAYVSVGFSTYALSRRYAWPPTALTVVLVAVSLPRIVYHATTPGTELIPAAVSIFCILAANRAVEQPNIRDFIFIFLGVLFSISGDVIGLIFPAILTALSAILLFRRHGSTAWKDLVAGRPTAIVAGLPFAAVFSQFWLYVYNSMHWGVWIGSLPGSLPNPDGIKGALANLCRYVVESAHMTKPLDFVCRHTIGFSPEGSLQELYDHLVIPIFGQNGAATAFSVHWTPDANVSWFGPLGFFLIIPAVLWALLRGHRRLKAIAIALVGYLYVMTFASAWMPGNARFFTVFFVCGAVCVASFLPPWRLTKRGKQFLHATSIFILIYACACNSSKPIMGVHPAISGAEALVAGDMQKAGKAFRKSVTQGVWAQIHTDSLSHGPRLFDDGRVTDFASLIPEGSKTALVAHDLSLAYPFLFIRRDLRHTVIGMNENTPEHALEPEKFDYVLFIDGSPESAPDGFTETKRWTADEKVSVLYCLRHD